MSHAAWGDICKIEPQHPQKKKNKKKHQMRKEEGKILHYYRKADTHGFCLPISNQLRNNIRAQQEELPLKKKK